MTSTCWRSRCCCATVSSVRAGVQCTRTGAASKSSVLSATEKVLDQSFDLKTGSHRAITAPSSVATSTGKRLSVDGRYIYGMEKIYNTIGERIGTRWSIQIGVAYRLFGS